MKHKLFIFMGLLALLAGCKKEKEAADTIYPEIHITAADAFPKQCSVVKKGEKFMFRASFSDNKELGAVSIDIHHNFDQHSHSTELQECLPDPKKIAVKPMLLIKSFPIPGGLTHYTIQQEIDVPADVDTGDYHFLIRLTDKSGWQTLKGLSIKIQ